MSDCSDEGLSYVAGFIAKKFPLRTELGVKTVDASASSCSWIMWKSNGGLRVPSEEFLEACRKFEAVFQTFHSTHKNGIDQDCNVIIRMSDVLHEKFPSWPKEVLEFFARTRTFIRIKHLNNCLKVGAAKAKLRSLKQSGQFQF